MCHHRSLSSLAFRALLLVTVGMLPAGCVITRADSRYIDREEKRFTVEGQPDVKLATLDGAILIRTWDRPEVLVTVEKHAFSKHAADAIEIVANQDGNHISVDVRVHDRHGYGFFWGDFARGRLVVSLPASSDVQASTGDGSIDLEGVRGTVSLKSGDGSIRARDTSGALAARSGDGSIRFDGVNGTIDANTNDGSIAVSGAFSGVRARSGDGSVSVHAGPGSSTETDWDISSGDGRIVVEVPDDLGAELDARTGDGRIHLDGVTLSNVAGDIGRDRASGRLGAGGHGMRIRTGDGSILLRRVTAP